MIFIKKEINTNILNSLLKYILSLIKILANFIFIYLYPIL